MKADETMFVLILGELSESAAEAIDFSDSWTDDDTGDVTAYAAQYAADAFLEDGDLA